MTEEKKMTFTTNVTILPPEIIEKVLKFFTYEKIYQAQLVCRRWKDIIAKGNLLKRVAGKTFLFSLVSYFMYLFELFLFRKNFNHHKD